MKVYLPIISGIICGHNSPKAYTSLKSACEVLNVPYDSAVRGKRVWDDKSIREIEIIKQVRVKG